MAEALYLPIDVETNRVLNVDETTNRRRFELIQGENYTAYLKFLSGNASYTPEIEEFSFVLRESSQAATDLIAVTGLNAETGSYPYSFHFTAASIPLDGLLEDVTDYADYSAQIVYSDGGELEIIAPLTARVTAVNTGISAFDFVSTVNGIDGAVILTGAGGTTVTANGQTLTISSEQVATDNFVQRSETGQFLTSAALAPYALTADVSAADASLQAQIATLQGQTGSFLTGVDLSAYATKAALNATGAALSSRLLSLENETGNYVRTSETGQFYSTENPAGYITTDTLAPYATTAAVDAADAALQGQLNELPLSYVLLSQTGQFYSAANPAGYITAAALTPYATAANLALTGSNLQGQILAISAATGGFLTVIPADVVRTTGEQIIDGAKTFSSRLQVGQGSSTLIEADTNGPILSFYDQNGSLSINALDRTLADSSASASLNWENKQLTGDWQTDTVPTLGAHILNKSFFESQTGTLTGQFVKRSETGSFGGGGSAVIPSDVVRTTGNQTIGGNKTFTGQNFVVTQGAGDVLYASEGFLELRDSNGSNAIAVGNRNLHDSASIVSLDWESRLLRGNAGTIVIDWLNHGLFDASENGALNWNSRMAYDAAFGNSLDWNSRQLINGDGAALDWQGYNLYGSEGVTAVNWDTRLLNDEGGNPAAHWNNRQLSGDWQTDTVPTIGAHIANKSYADATAAAAAANVVRTTGAQVISGQKTFADTIVAEYISGVIEVIGEGGNSRVNLSEGSLRNLSQVPVLDWNSQLLSNGNWYLDAYGTAANHVANRGLVETGTLTLTNKTLDRSTTKNVAETQQTLTCATGVAWNANNGGVAKLTVTGNPTVLNPTNTRDGATYMLEIAQGTGNSVVSWGSNFVWAGGTAPTITATSGKRDFLTFLCSNNGKLYGVAVQNFA